MEPAIRLQLDVRGLSHMKLFTQCGLPGQADARGSSDGRGRAFHGEQWVLLVKSRRFR